MVRKYKLYYITRHSSYDLSQQGKYAGLSEDEWREAIVQELTDIWQQDEIEFMHYIFHDMDKKGDGSPMPVHCHVLVRFKKSKEQREVMNLFDVTREENCQNVRSGHGKSKYLIHITDTAMNERKTIYSPSDVQFFGNIPFLELLRKDFWQSVDEESLKRVKEARARDLIDKISYKVRKGLIDEKDAITEVEKECGYHYAVRSSTLDNFKRARDIYLSEKEIELKEKGRCLKSVYITGSGGIGKTWLSGLLSRFFADGRMSDVCFATTSAGGGKTSDAFDLYRGESVITFDEVSPHTWELSEFLDVFDPKNVRPVPSRHKNKVFIGHTCVFTNSISPLRFAKDLLIFSKGGSKYQDSGNKRELNANDETVDKYWQVRRRFSNIIALERDANNRNVVNGYVFNLRQNSTVNNQNHVLVGTFSFHYDNGMPVISDDEFKRLIDLLEVSSEGPAYDNAGTIMQYVEAKDLDKLDVDSSIESFVNEIVNECVWDLLPTKFLYEMYKKYMSKYFPSEKIISIQEMKASLELVLTDWEYKKDKRVGTLITIPEPLIDDYFICGEWESVNTYLRFGSGSIKDRYSGFVRK